VLHRRTVLALSAALLVLSSPAFAQRWGRERTPRDGACFYEDADYRGDYFCARAGDSIFSLPSDINDRISSIRIFGGAQVTVFSGERLTGRSARFDQDVRNLRRGPWNDRISSFEVRQAAISGRPGPGFQGDPDRIVRRAYEDILGREPDSAGLRLYRSRLIDDGWTEQQVREALRSSPEFREKSSMTREKAEAIVRQAYLTVLKREPDAGAGGYVNRVLRERWTQADVERELRKSPEYRGHR
jgi:hypothetical protein